FDRISHPGADHALGNQIARRALFIGHVYGHKPTASIGVLAQQGGVTQHFLVHFNDFALDRGYHFAAPAPALARPNFLALTYPLPRFRESDPADIASQSGGKFVGTVRGDVAPFTLQPGMTWVISQAVWGKKPSNLVEVANGWRLSGRRRRRDLSAMKE